MNDEKLEELRYYFTGYGSQHDETILKLITQNKRYREALDIMLYHADNEEVIKDVYETFVGEITEESE